MSSITPLPERWPGVLEQLARAIEHALEHIRQLKEDSLSICKTASEIQCGSGDALLARMTDRETSRQHMLVKATEQVEQAGLLVEDISGQIAAWQQSIELSQIKLAEWARRCV